MGPSPPTPLGSGSTSSCLERTFCQLREWPRAILRDCQKRPFTRFRWLETEQPSTAHSVNCQARWTDGSVLTVPQPQWGPRPPTDRVSSHTDGQGGSRHLAKVTQLVKWLCLNLWPFASQCCAICTSPSSAMSLSGTNLPRSCISSWVLFTVFLLLWINLEEQIHFGTLRGRRDAGELACMWKKTAMAKSWKCWCTRTGHVWPGEGWPLWTRDGELHKREGHQRGGKFGFFRMAVESKSCRYRDICSTQIRSSE